MVMRLRLAGLLRSTVLALLATLGFAGLARPAGSAAAPQGDGHVDLQIRVFDGIEEVTLETEVTLYRAGRQDTPLARGETRPEGIVFRVPVGSYDAQAIRLEEGRVVAIRWAEGLTVAMYPNEAGRHLEVINFQRGHGALQLREPGDRVDRPAPWEAMAFAPGDRTQIVGRASMAAGYGVLVLPAGTYDVLVRRGGDLEWHAGVDVPLGRTALRDVGSR
jgi:hypothetical protein